MMVHKALLILLSIILGIFLFYWFQWRPSEIRKQCLQETKAQIKKEIDKPGDTTITYKDLSNMYSVCLVGHGMKPESIN